jgi:hypothetical protein
MNRKIVGAMIGLAGVLTLVSLAFILPMKHSGAHDLPVGVAGPAAATALIESQLRAQSEDAFDFHRYDSADDLRSGIEEREIVGGIAVQSTGPTMFVTSAGGAQVAQTLRGVATAMSAASSTPVAVEDVVPTTTDDPQGAGIAGLALPLVLGGIIPAVVFGRLLPGKFLRQGCAAVGMAVLTGFALGLILRFGLGTIDSNVIAVSLGIALGMSAISLTLLGLAGNFGMIGFGAGAVIMMIVGNPLSGIATTAYWLPSGWAELGQLLPPGASGTLLRSLAFFGGHGGGSAFIVLLVWSAVGTGLLTLAQQRSPAGAAETPGVRTAADA